MSNNRALLPALNGVGFEEGLEILSDELSPSKHVWGVLHSERESVVSNLQNLVTVAWLAIFFQGIDGSVYFLNSLEVVHYSNLKHIGVSVSI